MDLELATTDDILQELLNRRIRFAFVAVEDTNSGRRNCAWFSGKGTDDQEVACLFDLGREAFERYDDNSDDAELETD